MPVFTNDSLVEGIVRVGGASASGAAYTAKPGDLVVAVPGASGATGANGVWVTLPSITTLFPQVATQSDWVAATGPGGPWPIPVASPADGVIVKVRNDGAASSAPVGVSTSPLDPEGTEINEQAGYGATGTPYPVALGVSLTFVSKGGNWYTV